MTALPDMQVFHAVPVVPIARVHGMVPTGGPIWPEFPDQVAARHCRDGKPVDTAPVRPQRMRRMNKSVVWGGFLNRQFGHLVGEHLTRLPQSLRDRPDDLYLFTVHPRETAETLPGFIWDVLDWYGVRRDRVWLIRLPWLVKELRVAAQGEMLGGVPTPAEFLDLLELTAARNALQPEPNPLVYVTRAGMVAAGKGGHAGEAYLSALLERLGVKVIDPGHLPIRRQMELYAGARVLVFAEGSALHGRCLLGRVAQDIHVLRRRSMRNTARVQLTPRCRRLSYHQVLAGRLGTRTEARGSRVDLEVALYDPEVLFAVFRGLGIDLRPHWDHSAYRAAVRADLIGWMAANPTSPQQRAENLEVLAELELAQDLWPEPPALHGAPAPETKGQTDGPVHAAEEFQGPHRQDLAQAGGQAGPQVPDLPLEPR
jgi:hypothetical protein